MKIYYICITTNQLQKNMGKIKERLITHITDQNTDFMETLIQSEMEDAQFAAEQLKSNLAIPEGELTPLQRLFKHIYKDIELREHLNTSHWPDNTLQLINQPFHITHHEGGYVMETYIADRVVIFQTRFFDKMLEYLHGYLTWNV